MVTVETELRTADAAAADPRAALVTGPAPAQSFGPVAMNCIRRGQGKPLLLLHGLGGTWRSWQPILDALAKERSVIALDLPGFGETRPLAVPLSIPHLADQVTAFLRGHALTGIDVAGVSAGGRLALELARRGAVGTAVALDPGGFSQGWQRSLYYWSLSALIRLLRLLRPILPELLARPIARTLLLAQLSPRPWRLEPGMVRTELEGCAASLCFDELLRSLSYGPPPLGTGPGPTGKIIIGWGRQDRVCLPGQARRALNLFPTAELHWFERAGHYPFWDCPDETARLILSATA